MGRGYRLKVNGEYIDENLQDYMVIDDGEYRAEYSPWVGWAMYIYVPMYCETCGIEVVKGMLGCFVDREHCSRGSLAPYKLFFCGKCYPKGVVIGTITYD